MDKGKMLALMLLAASCLPEQDQAVGTNGTQTAPPATAASPGPQFAARAGTSQALADVHQVHVHQIALARLANEKSRDPGVRAFAERMIREHTIADAELVQLSRDEQIALETADQRRYTDQLDTVQRLRGLDGAAFDQAYVQEMIQGHDAAASIVQTSIATEQDPEVKAYFERLQPILTQHLEAARQIRLEETGA